MRNDAWQKTDAVAVAETNQDIFIQHISDMECNTTNITLNKNWRMTQTVKSEQLHYHNIRWNKLAGMLTSLTGSVPNDTHYSFIVHYLWTGPIRWTLVIGCNLGYRHSVWNTDRHGAVRWDRTSGTPLACSKSKWLYFVKISSEGMTHLFKENHNDVQISIIATAYQIEPLWN